jgi:hypothetical protein
MENKTQVTPESETHTSPQEIIQINTQKPKAPKQKSSLVMGLTVLVFILLVVGSFFAYQNYQLRQEIAQQKITPAPLPELTQQPENSSPTPSADVTDNWQSYYNNEYQFSFKYPNDYHLSKEYLKTLPEDSGSFLGIVIVKEENRELGQPPTIGLSIVQTEKSAKEFIDYVYQKELTTWENFEKENDFSIDKPYIISEENVQNEQLEAIKIEKQSLPTSPNSKETWYLIKKEDLLYVLSVNYGTFNPDTNEDGSDEKDTLDLLFSTFKFNKNENNYVNNQLGFSLKIPNSWEGFYEVEVSDNRVTFNFISEDSTYPRYQLFTITKTTQQKWEAQVNETKENSTIPPFSGHEKSGDNLFFFTQSFDNPFTGTEGDKYQSMSTDINQIRSSFSIHE